MAYETILWDRTGPTATLTFNRPESRNAIYGPMMGELYEVLDAASRDETLRVLVVRGAGRDFCPGADVKAYNSGASGGRATSIEDFNVTVMLHEMPAVTIAAVKGACAGAGMGWAMACDFRVADNSARFNTAFLNVGVAGDMGMPWTLPRLVGAAKARELFMLGEKFDGAEAYRLGLVSRLFNEATYEEELQAIVDRLAAAAPLALTALKGNFIAGEKLSFADYIRFEAERHGKLFASADTKEAFAAYVEKRKPVFHGR